METFAFLVHPLDINDVAKKYRIAKKVSPRLVAEVLRRRRPFVISEIEGIISPTGSRAIGWFIAVPLLPWQFMELEEEYVIEKMVKACRLAEKQGAQIIGLGAFTAIVGQGGRLLAGQVKLPVTTGNTYTTATAIEGTREAVAAMGLEPKESVLAIVGATGSIGRACAEVLAGDFGEVRLVGRHEGKLDEVAGRIRAKIDGPITTSTSIDSAIEDADVIITVTGAVHDVIDPRHIKAGAVVCDVARPRDVSQQVSQVRDDVLVIDGGIVQPPGRPDFNFDFGPPKGMCEGCVGETILLALEGRYESYTIGKKITVDKVSEMNGLARKHGFKLAGLRRFESIVTQGQISIIKANANRRRVTL